MIDSLLQTGLSNTCIAFALALVAIAIGAKFKRPDIAHLLWLLVFVKLITPPLLAIPVITTSAITTPSQVETSTLMASNFHPVETIALHEVALIPQTQTTTVPATLMSTAIPLIQQAKPWLVSIWLLGSALFLIASLFRIYRFNRLLNAHTQTAPPELQAAASKIAHQLGLKTTPTILATSARISPVVWWVGGKVRVVIPTLLLKEMDKDQWESILAHELAHVRRRDYLVRWLEWSVLVCFWWNPVAWWGQRMLREAEEMCCDALVLNRLKPEPIVYANSLLQLVESLAYPAFRPPALASEINSGGHLERRFKMIVSKNLNRNTSRTLKACVLMGAIAILPLGLVSAHEETEEVLHETLHEVNEASQALRKVHEAPHVLHEVSEAPHVFRKVHEAPRVLHEVSEAPHVFRKVHEAPHVLHEISEAPHPVHEIIKTHGIHEETIILELQGNIETMVLEREARIRPHLAQAMAREIIIDIDTEKLHEHLSETIVHEINKVVQQIELEGEAGLQPHHAQTIAREVIIEFEKANQQQHIRVQREQLNTLHELTPIHELHEIQETENVKKKKWFKLKKVKEMPHTEK